MALVLSLNTINGDDTVIVSPSNDPRDDIKIRLVRAKGSQARLEFEADQNTLITRKKLFRHSTS